MHPSTRLGIVLDEVARVSRTAVQGVDLLLLRSTLMEPPRRAGARALAERLARSYPNAEIVPYVWHLVSHGPGDGLRGHSVRTLAGPPHLFGGLQDTAQVAQAWEATCECASGLGARRVVLQTPPSLTPGGVGRARLAAFAKRAGAQALELVWEPLGLWSPDDAGSVAEHLKMPVLWPVSEPGRAGEAAPAGAWILVERLGRGGRTGPELQEMLEDLAFEGATILFGGPRAVANLGALRRAE